jgi:nitrilase
VVSRGGSCIIGPLGEILVAPNFEGECILRASVDLKDLDRARFDFDPVGHYSRPDIFQLIVDETPRTNMVTVNRACEGSVNAPSIAAAQSTTSP